MERDSSQPKVIDASHPEFIQMLEQLKKGMKVSLDDLQIKEGETSPPKRYSSGSMILAMENAGQLIERRRAARPDQGQRHRNECNPRGDPEKVVQHQIHGAQRQKRRLSRRPIWES